MGFTVFFFLQDISAFRMPVKYMEAIGMVEAIGIVEDNVGERWGMNFWWGLLIEENN